MPGNKHSRLCDALERCLQREPRAEHRVPHRRNLANVTVVGDLFDRVLRVCVLRDAQPERDRVEVGDLCSGTVVHLGVLLAVAALCREAWSHGTLRGLLLANLLDLPTRRFPARRLLRGRRFARVHVVLERVVERVTRQHHVLAQPGRGRRRVAGVLRDRFRVRDKIAPSTCARGQLGHQNALQHHAALLVPVKGVLRQPVLAQRRVKNDRKYEAPLPETRIAKVRLLAHEADVVVLHAFGRVHQNVDAVVLPQPRPSVLRAAVPLLHALTVPLPIRVEAVPRQLAQHYGPLLAAIPEVLFAHGCQDVHWPVFHRLGVRLLPHHARFQPLHRLVEYAQRVVGEPLDRRVGDARRRPFLPPTQRLPMKVPLVDLVECLQVFKVRVLEPVLLA